MTPPQAIAKRRAKTYTRTGFLIPTCLRLENRVVIPIAVNVKAKNITCRFVVPKLPTGATAACPAATVGEVEAITERAALVKMYPITNLGNRYQITSGLTWAPGFLS